MSLKQRLGLTETPLFLMDGSAFVYRSFYANRHMRRSDGFPTSVLLLAGRQLLRILKGEQPSHFVFFLDGKGKNFRHELFPAYKANRDVTPEDLVKQLEPVRRLVGLLGVPLEVSENCEADDCIASVAARFAGERSTVIIGADKDLKQCLAPGVYLWDPSGREEKLMSEERFREETGLDPSSWADIQAVVGDSCDNIPGIPGIGPKTAEKIFRQFPTLEALRDGLDQLAPNLRKKVEGHMDAAFLYRRLTRLDRSRCPHLTWDRLALRAPDITGLMSFINEYELFSLQREVAALAGMPLSPRAASSQASLLDFSTSAPAPAVPGVETVAELPPCAGVPVAFLPLPSASGGGFSVATAEGERRYTGSVEALAGYLAEAVQLIVPDVKALLGAHAAWRALPRERWFDLGLAAYLLQPEERDYSWAHLAARFAPQSSPVQRQSASMALSLATVLSRKLAEAQLDQLYEGLEVPLIPILADMERLGIAVDARAFAAFLQEVQGELDRLTEKVYAAAGRSFNIRSAQQLGEVLFQTLQLPSSGKTRGGQLSTSQEKLEKLAGKHPVVDAVLEYRKLEKLRSTYLEPMPRMADAQGRLHTTFNQTATATGRLSSSNPNLQNIPVRGPLGKRMRACFIAQPGHVLVSADYSQVELRVLAHASRDPVLLRAFREQQDIHRGTAALMYDIAPEDVSLEQRRNAKTINFGLIYGMGAQKLAQELNISVNEAKAFITRYFERLDTLKRFYDSVEASARELGYVTTLAGRRRSLPDIFSRNGQAFSLARRQAINTVIQGSAADIIKLAMLAVQQDTVLQDLGARLVLQVHDELLLEVPAKHAEKAGAQVVACMEGVCPGGVQLSVPLVVDWGVGASWGEAH